MAAAFASAIAAAVLGWRSTELSGRRAGLVAVAALLLVVGPPMAAFLLASSGTTPSQECGSPLKERDGASSVCRDESARAQRVSLGFAAGSVVVAAGLTAAGLRAPRRPAPA